MSIRLKVALLLSVLVAVILYMSVSRITSLQEKETQFLNLTETSRTSFETMTVLRLSSLQIDSLAREILSAEDSETLETIGDQSEETLEDARRALRVSFKPERRNAQIFSGIDALHDGMTEAIAARAAHLAARRAYDASDQRLERALDLLQAQVSRLNGTLPQNPGEDAPSAAEAAWAERLVHLRIAASGLLDLGRSLAALHDPAQANFVSSEVTSRVEATLWAISALGPFPDRADTLERIRDLRESIQGSDGVLDLAGRLVEADRRLDLATQKLERAMTAARATLDQIAGQSERELAAVYEDARKTTREAIFSEILFSWLVAGGLVAAVWAVFSLQISRRIEILSEDVLRIARGDLDRETSIDGGDEIGRMAQALAVFRHTARELYRSNEQLDDFAYVASHDLKSPLRAIRDLVEWTFEDFDGDLTPEVAKNLCLIRERAERLSQLLSDLLAYARADLTEKIPEQVDLLVMTEDTAELVDPEERFSVTYQGERHVASFPSPLRTILRNLIANAIAHHDRTTGTVSVIGKRQGARFVLHVMDDGPGIEGKYQEQIFHMFQTLRVGDEMTGSGMGLALVRKLAHSLDGEIKVSSNPNKSRGTTFTLNIPISAQTAFSEFVDSTKRKGAAA